MPQARSGEATIGLEMEIKTRGVNILAAVGKPHGNMRFVGSLVIGKSRVAIDPKHGPA